MTIGKSGWGWMTVLHSDMEKQHRRVFLPHNCCQLSSETDRENDVKKREKGEKVWVWVNSVYPCHMSLVYQFPHCSLVAANSSSDTKTMNTHALRTRLTRPWAPENTCRTESRRATNQCVLQVVSSLWQTVSPHFSWFTEQKWKHTFSLRCSSAPTFQVNTHPKPFSMHWFYLCPVLTWDIIWSI